MRRCFSSLLVLATLWAIPCVAARDASGKVSPAQLNVAWDFQTRLDSDNNPQTRVFLIVNGRRIFVMRDTSQYHQLGREQYAEHDVPAAALAACTSWWAGSGSEMYVVRRRRQLVVYIRYLDEGAETEGYVRLKVIPLRK